MIYGPDIETSKHYTLCFDSAYPGPRVIHSYEINF